MSAGQLALDIYQFQLMGQILRNEAVAERQIDVIENYELVLGLIWLIWFPATVIAFVMWAHRAHRNLPALGATGLEFSPRGAVGWYFVPFLNLFKPYQVMREIYNASEPSVTFESESEWRSRNAPAIIKIWWTLFLFSSFVGNAVMRESLRADTPEAIQILDVASIIHEILAVALTVAAIWLVWAVTERQDRRAKALARAA
jgi:hypothetical protein